MPNRKMPDQIGKRILFDLSTWHALENLAQDQMKDIPEVMEEASRDILRKYGRSADFRQQLRMSAQENDDTVIPMRRHKTRRAH